MCVFSLFFFFSALCRKDIYLIAPNNLISLPLDEQTKLSFDARVGSKKRRVRYTNTSLLAKKRTQCLKVLSVIN